MSVTPLLRWLEDNGVKAADFARKIGVSDQVLGNWKRRGSVPMDNLQMVAAAMELSMDEYVAEAQGKRPPKIVAQRRVRYDNARNTDAVIEIPRLDVRGSMGPGAMRPGVDLVVGHLQVNAEWVRRNLPDISSPSNLRIITGYGDSMESTFFDGDPLVADTGVREVRIDAVYAFTLDDEIYIKTLQRLPGKSLKVISDNKSKYDAYVLDGTSRQRMEILARIVWAWNGRKL